MIRASPTVLLTIFVALADGCTAPRNGNSWADLPVTHDPRPMYVLFSWVIADGDFRFALIRDRQLGGARNDFLAGYDRGNISGRDLPSLKRALARIPRNSVVEWWFETDRHLGSVSSDALRSIRRIVAERASQFHFHDADHDEA